LQLLGILVLGCRLAATPLYLLKEDVLNIAQIKDGITLAINNALSLLNESTKLFENKSYARSYTLSHISIEEISKISMLLRIGLLTRINGEVNWKVFWKKFKDHKNKIINNSFWVLFFAQYVAGFDEKWYVENSQKVIDKKNDLKNNSLYVGFDGNKFYEPSSIVLFEKAELELKFAKATVIMVDSIKQNLFDLFDKDENELLRMFESLENYSKETLVEFLNYYEEIITS